MEDTDLVFISPELDKTGGRVAYYRLDAHFREFIQKLVDKEGIDGIIISKEGDKVTFNLGFILTNHEE